MRTTNYRERKEKYYLIYLNIKFKKMNYISYTYFITLIYYNNIIEYLKFIYLWSYFI